MVPGMSEQYRPDFKGIPDNAPWSGFQLPESAGERIRAFHDDWLQAAESGMPPASRFDIAALSADFALLARIGLEEATETLVWREVAPAERWPFGRPVAGRSVAESVPPSSLNRAIASFRAAMETRMPDYFETTSWMHGGQTVSLARLVLPVAAAMDVELLALWETGGSPARYSLED